MQGRVPGKNKKGSSTKKKKKNSTRSR